MHVCCVYKSVSCIHVHVYIYVYVLCVNVCAFLFMGVYVCVTCLCVSVAAYCSDSDPFVRSELGNNRYSFVHIMDPTQLRFKD